MYKGRIYPFVHSWKRSLNIHKLQKTVKRVSEHLRSLCSNIYDDIHKL